MMIIEMKEAAYSKAFELLDEIKELGKKKKMVLCELEDAIYECYEASKDGSEEESELKFKNYRSGIRRHDDEDDEDMYMSGYRRSRGMRMRGYRSGRYSY